MYKLLYKGIKFDDFVDEVEEYGTYYVEICNKCYQKHKAEIGNRLDENSAEGCCSVEGCWNDADHYVGFVPDDIQIVEEPDFTDGNFVDDAEKMRDFKTLSKEEFLESYSYLTEAEYDNTMKIYNQ